MCKKGFWEDYIEKDQSNAIKGLFILLVFMRHILQRIKRSGFVFDRQIDLDAYLLQDNIGQLVVVMFLFYSGYGVMKSLLIKGEDYLSSYPRKRLLTTLLNFDVAVCFFIILGFITKRPMSLSTVLLSFIGWDTVGNSNWYIFVILFCYLVFYLVFRAVQSRHAFGALVVTLIVFLGMIALHSVKPAHWYNTMLVFPAGIYFALCYNSLERIIQKYYWLFLAILLAVFLLLHFGHFRPLHGLTFNLKSIVFALLLVVLTMKVRIRNKWLIWCGTSLFPIYIYQRLPLILIWKSAGDTWLCANPNLYIAICFVLTLGLTLIYNKYLRIII